MRALARLAALGALILGVLAVLAVFGSRVGVKVVRTPAADRDAPQATPTPQVIPAPALQRRSGLERPGAGLSVADRGLRIVVAVPIVPLGATQTVRFRLAGAPARRVALAVVRRDGRFLSTPPARLEGGGDWAAELRLPKAGVYRLIADVDGGRHVVGTDLFVPGDFAPLALPAPSGESAVGSYAARLRGGAGGRPLRMTVRRGSQAVRARPAGPVVAFRAGDLAYASASARGTGTGLRFAIEAPGPGTYRLFVPFADRGRTVTAAFTRTVARQRPGRSG